MAIRLTIRTNELAIQKTTEDGEVKGPEFVIPAVTTPFTTESDPPNRVSVNVHPDDLPRLTAAVRSASTP